jgi:hypothetical protein
MRKNVGVALFFSCLAHAALLVLWTPAGHRNAASRAYPDNSSMIVAKLYPSTLNDASTPLPASLINPRLAAATAVRSARQSYVRRVDVTNKSQTGSVAEPANSNPASDLNGLSDIVYWTFEDVDQGALMLAQWPENMIIAPWPSERPVQVEVWVNPDGALAKLNFPQEDLPISVKVALSDSIRQYGFTPALKDGVPVGNHRILELLLSQTTVPAFVVR